MTRISRTSKTLALLLCATTTSSSASPGDITRTAAPIIGADPPARVQIASGDAKVSPQTGALELGFTFKLPPGRGAMTPSLGLSYSSQAALRGGVAAGWSLGIPHIERDATTGLGEERFISTLAGSRELVEVSELAPADVVDTFRAQGDDSYARYQRMQPWVESHRWQVLTTDGVRHEFGGTTQLSGRYPLTRSIDAFGNTIEYVWEPVVWGVDVVDLRLRYIRYGKNLEAGLADHHAEVELVYEAADACGAAPVGAQLSIDALGKQYRGASKLVGVYTRVRPTPGASFVGVRRWRLVYDADASRCDQQHSPLRILQSIWELEPQSGISLRPPTTFAYGDLDRQVSGTISTSFPAGLAIEQRFGWGERKQGNGKWSTLETQLLDLDADARPDRLVDVSTPEARYCELGWDRNTVATAQVAFTDAVGTSSVPRIPWTNAHPDFPELYDQWMDGEDDCSLTGQLSYYEGLEPEPNADPLCVTHIGHYNAYRYLDMDVDGIPDLVTALHYDPLYWEPPVPPPPPSGESGPPCAVLDATCVNDTLDCVDNGRFEECTIDWPALDGCVDDAPAESCFDSAIDLEPIYAKRPPFGGDQYWQDLPIEDPDPSPPPDYTPDDPCLYVRTPLGTDFHYPWIVYRGIGDGRFDVANPRTLYAPIPLQSHTGDPVTLTGSHAASTQAIIDLDGDGYLDAIHRLKDATCEPAMPCPNHKFWWVWRGTPDGRFVGPESGSHAYLWKVPEGAYPSVSYTVEEPTGERVTSDLWGLRDLNGDGRPDLVGLGGVVHWNLGRLSATGGGFSDIGEIVGGFDVLGRASTDAVVVDHGVGHHKTLFTSNDLDGDGLTDWIDLSREVRWGNAGGYTPGVIVAGASIAVEDTFVDGAQEGGLWHIEQTMIDLDGDGLLDGADYDSATARSEVRDGTHRALLKTIDNGNGLVTRVEYAAAAHGGIVTMNGGRLPSSLWVVSSIDVADAHAPVTAEERTRYAYLGPVWNQDPSDRWGFRGFAETRTTAPSGSVTVAHFGYDIDWSGREIKTEVYASDADRIALKPATMTETRWAAFDLFGASVTSFHPTRTWAFTCRPNQTITGCRNSGAVLRTVATWSALTPTNVAYPVLHARTQDQSLDQMTAADQGDTRTRTVHKVYYGATSTILRSSNDYVDEYRDGAFRLSGRTRHVYDAAGEVELRTEVFLDAIRFAATARTYDAAGNVLTVRRPEAYAQGSTLATTFAYDAWKLHVASTTNELGHVVHTDHDVGTGLVTATRGPNSKGSGNGTTWQGTRTVYDFLGRPVEQWVNIDNNNTYSPRQIERTTYADFTSPPRVTREKRIDYSGTAWVTVETLHDGHGRPFRETTRTFDVNVPDAVTSRTYDHRGHVVAFSSPDPSVTDGTVVTHTYAYDAIGRPTALRDPLGNGVNISYSGLVETRAECALVGTVCTDTPDEALAVTETTKDARQRLRLVRERQSDGAWAVTSYEYDAHGKMARIVNADLLETRLEHDWVGNRLAIRRGVGTEAERAWTYQYDLDGNLIAEVVPHPAGADPVLYTTTYAYDVLDRETSRLQAPLGHSAATLAELGIGLVTTSYDVGQNAKGLPHRTETPMVAVDFAYDALGRVKQETHALDLADAGVPLSVSRGFTRSYNALGLETTTWHADGATVTQKLYDRRGLPAEVRDVTSGQSLATIRNNTAGRITEINASNKAQHILHDELGRVTRVDGIKANSFPQVATTLVSQTYAYGASSEIVQLVSTVAGLGTRSFELSYDDQHQLDGAIDPTNAAAYEATLTYSPAGRILTADVESNSGAVFSRHADYDYASPAYPDLEAVKALRDGGTVIAQYTYDSLGNVTARSLPPAGLTWTFAYDADAQRRVTAPGGASETYYYLPSGQRSAAVDRNPGGTVQRVRLWVGESEMWFTPAGTQTHRFSTVSHGQPILRTQSTPSTSLLEVLFTSPAGHTLGTVAHVASASALTSGFQYGPLGEILGETDATATHLRRFNGKEHDELSDLYYYGFRYYDPLSLRWTQADPLYRFAPDLAWNEPRRMGLYTFDLNNPMRYLDPDGLDPTAIRDKIEAGEKAGKLVAKGVKQMAGALKDAYKDGAKKGDIKAFEKAYVKMNDGHGTVTLSGAVLMKEIVPVNPIVGTIIDKVADKALEEDDDGPTGSGPKGYSKETFSNGITKHSLQDGSDVYLDRNGALVGAVAADGTPFVRSEEPTEKQKDAQQKPAKAQ